MRAALPSVLLFVAACPPPSGTTTDGDQPSTNASSSTSTTTGSTTSDQPTTSVGPESTVSTSPTSPTPPDLPPPCPVGAEGCPCTGGGFCDGGLLCEDGTCVDAGCAIGSLGCSCTAGGGCDGGLSCDDGTCVEGFSPPCDPEIIDDDCCGNQIVDDLEECDPGPYVMDDTGPCTTKCKNAVCGDGFVQTNVEACDGGDECTPACTLKSCGNGVVDPGEWCEPENDADLECTPLCGDGRKIIFVSSEHYKGGEIGGIAGGDEKCQALADAAGLVGVFKAWLASSMDDAPLVRFTWLEGPYVDVNGDQIAATWTEIYSSANPAPIITEYGVKTSDSEIEWLWKDPITHLIAWASRLGAPGGPGSEPAHCGNWSDVDKTGGVALLDPNPEVYMSGTFNVAWAGASCALAAPIICVEQ